MAYWYNARPRNSSGTFAAVNNSMNTYTGEMIYWYSAQLGNRRVAYAIVSNSLPPIYTINIIYIILQCPT